MLPNLPGRTRCRYRARRVERVGALARVTIRGERVYTPGPVIYAANHVSTFDAMLFFLLLPPDTVFVGRAIFRWSSRVSGWSTGWG